MYEKMAIAWLVMETVIIVLFFIINRSIGPETTGFISSFKGILERIYLIGGILVGYPQVIIAFGALKIGTRLHDAKNSKISNDYFLIGNFLSLTAAITYVTISKHLFGFAI